MGFIAKPLGSGHIECPNCGKPIAMQNPPAPGQPTDVSLYKCGWCPWESKWARQWKRIIAERGRAA